MGKQNLKNMREKQKMAQLEKENQAKLANMKKKSSKYSKIDSKLKQTMSANPSSASLARTQPNTNFLLKNKAKIQCQSSLNSTIGKKDKISTKRKAAIPTRAELNISKEKSVEKKDFISMNKSNAEQLQNKRREEEQVQFVKKKDYGKVPDYIIKRKLAKEELEQKMMEEAEAAKIPQGMRIMTDQEKAETLEILEGNKKAVIEKIKHLPLVIETPSMIKHQQNLNKQVKEIEKTIALFQKPTVFVAMD